MNPARDRPFLSILALGALVYLLVRLGAARQPGPMTILLVSASLVLGVLLISAWRSTARGWREGRRKRALRLADVDGMDGMEFERYVRELLEDRGFRARLTGCPDDRGVDLVAEREDVRYAVQVKRHAGPVSRRAVSDAVGGVRLYDCHAAMVITNSRFTRGAVDLAESNGCTLIDRDVLAEWILAFRNGTGRPQRHGDTEIELNSSGVTE